MVSLIHNVEVARDFPKRTCGLKFKMPKLAPEITVLNDPEEGALPKDADTGIGASYENARDNADCCDEDETVTVNELPAPGLILTLMQESDTLVRFSTETLPKKTRTSSPGTSPK